MSIKVDITKLQSEIDKYGDAAFVLTSSGDSRPHIIELRVTLVDGQFQAIPGRSCGQNVSERPELSLLWPAPDEGGYSLIVDGTGEISRQGDNTQLIVVPTGAVLHRPAP